MVALPTYDRGADFAGRLIATFEPGLVLAPAHWETLASALRTVELDHRATGPSREAVAQQMDDARLDDRL